MRAVAVALIISIFAILPAQAQHGWRGDQNIGKPAPELDIDEWINGGPVTLKELQGRVVIIDFFQLWCPGCNAFSIPLLKYWEDVFAEEIKKGKLVVLSIHTVFEGHDYQNPERLREFLKRKKIHHIVGIDRHGSNDRVPETMIRFGTRGTPEMAFIGKQGKIRFQRFGSFNVEAAEELLRDLLAETPPA